MDKGAQGRTRLHARMAEEVRVAIDTICAFWIVGATHPSERPGFKSDLNFPDGDLFSDRYCGG
jgi:hypothetical protein